MNAQSIGAATPFDQANPLHYRIVVGGLDISLRDFLVYCLDACDGRLPRDFRSNDLTALRQTFIEAGVRALETKAGISNWAQFGLAVDSHHLCPEFYARVAVIARQSLEAGSITNFFFMHKPPGMRVRFEINGAAPRDKAADLHRQLLACQTDGLLKEVSQAVYEPETHLFGGPLSMRFVHESFTIDSLAWLDYHAAPASSLVRGLPEWALSLAMLSPLFVGLGMHDFEDINVWDTIRNKLGRRLRDDARSQADFVSIASEIRQLWQDPQALLRDLPPEAQKMTEQYRRSIIPVAAHWVSDYFSTEKAEIGPRAAAGLWTIFHWNRGALQPVRQALLAEALAERGRL